ncbi:MAG: type II secretion system F family protein [Oscillospiraceae bacterium]|nr:type II secretion system F family protein [Oscillospiraceae bacterium]
MTEFNYVAVTNDGREAKGRITAGDERAARAELKRQNLLVVKIAQINALSRDIDFSDLAIFKKKPKSRDLSVFCRQFVSIINAGVPVIAALEMLAEQTANKVLSKAITETRISVEKGESLADSMRKNEAIFGGRMFISLVTAGEASGTLEISFSRMAEQFEKDTKLNDMVKKASVYPIVVLIVLVAVIGVMLIVVVPSFVGIFDELGTGLPAITMMVVNASNFMKARWYVVLIVVVGAIIAIREYAKTTSGKALYSRVTLKLPVIGDLIVKSSSARMSRTIGTLLAAGIPLIQSLEITANSMTNFLFRDKLMSAREDVAMGNALSDSIRKGSLFPPLVYQMMRIGEESGDMDSMLGKIADFYDQEVEAATQRVIALVEPAIIIIMAVVVGFIVMSIMLPLVNMYGALDNL